ncbi:ribonuclease D [Aliidiomarina sedimenti]|uniref:Ribonuclease D n=1 Tax=Aliidiomarina sedimenti TaxID=1933879 RepID=A0ABY0BXJ5_9GAMM|nr:ribonuclease D [Aliidiomarina sedimenti]RUO28912.1 ribonuclease D [Aliidiomarina sedimenti]
MSEVNYRFIDATKELVAFCDQAKTAGWLALDTEFVRERTFYAQLGLLQLAVADDIVLVDPLAGFELEPFWQLLADENVTKVLHSGGEDLELLYQCAQRMPQNVFDSQIAASVLGYGDSLGYAAMVQQFCDVELDKSQSRTDWLARPLSDDQRYYAAADVFYLARIYPRLLTELQQADKLALVADECALQIVKRTRQLNPDLAWREIGNAWQTSPQQRAVLQALAAWRLNTARRKDKPVGFIVKDATLIEIARKEAQSMAQLAAIDSMHPQAVRRWGDEIIAAVKTGLACPEENIPAEMPRLDFVDGYKGMFKKAKALIQRKAEELQVPASLIGSRKQINEVFHWLWFCNDALRQQLNPPDLLVGWRGELLKSELEALLLPRP